MRGESPLGTGHRTTRHRSLGGPTMPDLSRRQLLGIAGGAALVATAGRLPAAGAADRGSDAFVPPPPPIPVTLDAYLDNDAIDTASAHDGDFDGSGYTFPGEALPSGST